MFEDHLGRHERGEILNTDGTPNSFTRRPLINYLMADGVIIDSPYSQLDSISSLSSVDKPQEFSGAKVVVSSKGISPQGRPVVTIERANDISVLKITEEIVTATPSETSVKPVSQNTRLDHIYGSNVEKIPTKRPSKRVVKRSTTNSKAKQRKTDNHRSEDVVISAAIAPSENSMELANLVKDVQELINSSLYPIQPARELLEPELD